MLAKEALQDKVSRLRSPDAEIRANTLSSFLGSIEMRRKSANFTTAAIPFTPKVIIEKMLPLLAVTSGSSIGILYTVEWAFYLFSKGFTNVTLIVDQHDSSIEGMAKMLGYKYVCNILKENNMAFDVVIGNPPYNMKNEKGGITPLASKFNKLAFKLVKPDGIVGLVTSNTCLSPGQQTITPILFANEVLYVSPSDDGKNHFKVGQGICVFVVKMTPSHNTQTITAKLSDGKHVVDKDIFALKNSRGINVPYFPKYANTAEIKLLEKIIKFSNDSFQFRSSMSNNNPNITYFGFQTVRKVPASPKSFRYKVGKFNDTPHHPCAVNYLVSEEIARSVFCSKIFHWTLSKIVGLESADRPATLSYFPVVPLDQIYTHENFRQMFNLTDEENKLILDWADTKSANYWDEE